MEGPEITYAEAVIDNGSFGTRTIRFETGRLAKQAAGSVAVYLDGESMLLSATTVGKQPKDQFDFFPLTVDVEERMYAAGRIPGSFFRREGRPSTDAILTCRLIDRPLRPTFVKGLRNEVQVVITVLALNPDDLYDVVAINGASLSTQLSGLPFSGPIGGVRVALIDGQWVAFPRHSELERAVFDMVVAGRVVTAADGSQDVAIMMVEAEATDSAWDLIKNQGVQAAPTEEVVAAGPGGGQAVHRRARARAQQQVAAAAAKPTAEFPLFLDYQDDVYDGRRGRRQRPTSRGPEIAGKTERETRLDELKDAVKAQLAERVRRPREGDLGGLPRGAEEAGPPAHPARQGPHRRPRPGGHPPAVGRGRGHPAGARLGAVRARRDPDPRRHHAEHAPHGAADRHALARDAQALHAQLQLPAVQHR